MRYENGSGSHRSQETNATNDSTPLSLPEEFWSRARLRHIRQAAWARGRSADAVLYSTLARLSSLVSHDLRFDAGLGLGSLNLFTALVGPSGTGKSAGAAVAADLLHVPKYLSDPGAYRDRVGLGSGEGLAELFMGYRLEETLELKANGDPKTQKVRAQVRHNALVYVDEGQALTAMTGRTGATIGPMLRSAWVGETIGQANAREETTRHIPAHSYSLGLVIGYQRSTAQPLLADAAGGTPQRFLWANVTDPNLPEEPPDYPGPLAVRLDASGDWIVGSPLTGVIEFHGDIKKELWRHNRLKVRGEVEDAELDSHSTLMKCKVAALLALLQDRSNLHVGLDDWDLATIIWDTSCRVRDDLVAYGMSEQRRDAEARHAYAATREQRILESREDYEDKRLERVTRYMAKYMARGPEGGGCTEAVLKRAVASHDRKCFKEALELAKERKWIVTRVVEREGYGMPTTLLAPGPNVGEAS